MGVDLSAALDAVDAAFGAAGVNTYTPPLPGAAAISVVAVAKLEDVSQTIGPGRQVSGRGTFEVQTRYFEAAAAAVARAPVKDGVLTIGGVRWIIRELPELLDPERRVYTLRCQRETAR